MSYSFESCCLALLCEYALPFGCLTNQHCVTGDKFDPVPIANKLREVADRLQTEWDRELPAALLQLNANQEKVEWEIIVQKASVHLAIFGNCYMHRNKHVVVYLL